MGIKAQRSLPLPLAGEGWGEGSSVQAAHSCRSSSAIEPKRSSIDLDPASAPSPARGRGLGRGQRPPRRSKRTWKFIPATPPRPSSQSGRGSAWASRPPPLPLAGEGWGEGGDRRAGVKVRRISLFPPFLSHRTKAVARPLPLDLLHHPRRRAARKALPQLAKQRVDEGAFLDLQRLDVARQELLDGGRADRVAVHRGAAGEQVDLAGELAFVAVHRGVAVGEFGHFDQARVAVGQLVDRKGFGSAEVLVDLAAVAAGEG